LLSSVIFIKTSNFLVVLVVLHKQEREDPSAKSKQRRLFTIHPALENALSLALSTTVLIGCPPEGEWLTKHHVFS